MYLNEYSLENRRVWSRPILFFRRYQAKKKNKQTNCTFSFLKYIFIIIHLGSQLVNLILCNKYFLYVYALLCFFLVIFILYLILAPFREFKLYPKPHNFSSLLIYTNFPPICYILIVNNVRCGNRFRKIQTYTRRHKQAYIFVKFCIVVSVCNCKWM